MAEFLFKNTTATKKIFQLKSRIRAVAGGTSASKTISILVWLIDYAQSTKDEIITVVAESFPHLQLGAIRDFKAIMTAHGYWEEGSWNESKHIYTFATGSFIEFISFDKFGKAHGPRRDVLFLNECNNLEYEIADQLITRTRKIVWMDWNPSSEFWFYTEMLPNRKDIEFITLTYLDNEALDEVSKAEIESHRNNKNWWTVYGLGQLGAIEGRIYKDWAILDEIPHEARLERRGLDFGYSNDPTAIVDIYRYNGAFIFDEICYERGMSNRAIADLLKNQEKCLTLADSVEPKSIDEIRTYGIQILGAMKGPGSVEQGIQFIQDQKIFVTKRSVNLLKEYRNYLWMSDKNGKIINEPEDGNDHCMDAIRYGMSKYRSQSEASQYNPKLSINPYATASRSTSIGLRPR
jgi:phage terminase large subunit